MSLHRGIDGSSPLEPEPVGGPAGLHEERLARQTTRMAVGTLACPSCDAPTAPPSAPLDVTATTTCAFCATEGAVRDFLSLAEPTRPTRVVVHVRVPTRAGALRRR